MAKHKTKGYKLIPIRVSGIGTVMATVDLDAHEDLSWKWFQVSVTGRIALKNMPHGLGSYGERLYGTMYRNSRHLPQTEPYDLRRNTFVLSKKRLRLMKAV